ncbi:MAG: FAD-dependent monooxygenase [Chitinophagaceae bacterium]|nr:FAD-dependent monooxygenase [Chitinophagaceae bacterium]
MQQEVLLQLSPKDAAQSAVISENIANELGLDHKRVTGFHFIKKSIDARKRNVLINLKLKAFVDEPFHATTLPPFEFPDVRNAEKRTLVIGAGPAGLFAALELIQQGIKPIVIERGKDVRERRRDLAALNRDGILNEDSNYCFGEGGAGTYSDGKLYTRSTKRGNVEKVLQLLVHFGADPAILYTAHPHIGTNKLPGIIQNIRQQIIDAGGEVHFNEKVIDFNIVNQQIRSVVCASGNCFDGNNIILATGHSAKDIYVLLHQKQILIEAKPFALGVRIEHPQSLIDSIQYHCPTTIGRDEFLPPASYQLVEQVNGRGAFSFCMCPGGIIATASTVQKELVVNGWSPSKRNNPFANSGMVVQVGLEDVSKGTKGSLDLHHFQESVERRAYEAGGGYFVAPAQRMTDFVKGQSSSTLPENSYLRGVVPVNMKDVLPDFVFSALQNAFKAFGKKMKGYYTEEATIIAPESRTSSPVRIPRDPETLQHPQISNLYPCAEGAGYAGGIVSAAMDGQRVANHLSIFSAADNFSM